MRNILTSLSFLCISIISSGCGRTGQIYPKYYYDDSVMVSGFYSKCVGLVVRKLDYNRYVVRLDCPREYIYVNITDDQLTLVAPK